MVFSKKCFSRFHHFRYVRYSNTCAQPTLANFDSKLKFNNEQQKTILNLLNKSGNNELLELKVSKAKIKNLENYRNKHGPFQSLTDILEVDGLGVKVLEKLCDQIIGNMPAKPVKISISNSKRLKQFLAPSLSDINLQSSVGIHLAPTGVSWAKLLADDHLQCWSSENFLSLPKKMLPTDTFTLAYNILNKIPCGDVYVFEGASSMGLQGQKQPSAVTAYNNQLELTSMLLALLNTSSKHNTSILENNNTNIFNKVYFLRSKLPARLFKTLVGNECVSSTQTVSRLIDNVTTESVSLPCSPILLDPKLKADYLSKSPAQKELLGQALLLTVAFSNLCVKGNDVSLNAVAPGKR